MLHEHRYCNRDSDSWYSRTSIHICVLVVRSTFVRAYICLIGNNSYTIYRNKLKPFFSLQKYVWINKKITIIKKFDDKMFFVIEKTVQLTFGDCYHFSENHWRKLLFNFSFHKSISLNSPEAQNCFSSVNGIMLLLFEKPFQKIMSTSSVHFGEKNFIIQKQ